MNRHIGIAVFTILLLSGCESRQAGQEVTRSQFGDRWPLTVDRGFIDCVDGNAAVFRADGRTYALNGFAIQRGYLRIDPIWANDPSPHQPKKDIGPLMNRALAQC